MEKLIDVSFQRSYDVVVVGGGTSGVFAAIAAARTGAKTALVEGKGYVGGIVTEGGCGIHSFFNMWSYFPGVEKKKIIKGLPEELFDRLHSIGGSSGHNDAIAPIDYDPDCLFVDVEKYKYLAHVMLDEAGVDVLVNTTFVEAFSENGDVSSILTVSHQGTELIFGKMFIDATGYGDLSARAGANYTEPNDYGVANSIGVAGIDIDEYYKMFAERDCIWEYARGTRSGKPDQVIRFAGNWEKYDPALAKEMEEIGISSVTVTMHDDYFMFLKIGTTMEKTPTDRDCAAKTELDLRKRQEKAIEFMRRTIPNSENAFITRTCPSLLIRRARCIECDYDMTNEEILDAARHEDDVYYYAFHDYMIQQTDPKIIVKDGSYFGFPYRAMLPATHKNLYSIGMMITSNWFAHMSTRNTVSCMAQGQAAGTAAAMCVLNGYEDTRALPYLNLRQKLIDDNVYLDK